MSPRPELMRLLSACKNDPDDADVRLVLADWLEENGGEADRARARVIRLQMDEVAGGPSWGLTVAGLREKHLREWAGEDLPFFRRWPPECKRGLLLVEAPASAFMNGEGGEAWDWVETARVPPISGPRVRPLMESARLATVTRLELRRNPQSAPTLEAVAGHAGGRLRALGLGLQPEHLGVLASALRPGPEQLDLVLWREGSPPWEAFLGCPGVAALRGLWVWNSYLQDADVVRSPRQRRLTLMSARLTEAGVGRLIGEGLRKLELHWDAYAPGPFYPFHDTGCRDTLEELRLMRGFKATPAGLPRLRRLRLSQAGLDAASAAELARAPLGHLDELDLTNNPAGSGACAAAALAASGQAGPRTLRLAWCGVGNAGAASLAAWPGLSRVRHLDLRGNGITTAGVLALADSPHASALEALNIGDNIRITARGVAGLLRSPLGRRLRWLRLAGVSPNGLERAVSDNAGDDLRELRIDGAGIDSGGMARLRDRLPGCVIG